MRAPEPPANTTATAPGPEPGPDGVPALIEVPAEPASARPYVAVLVVRTGPDARCPQPVAAAALLDRLRAEGRITHVAFAADTVPDAALRATAARLADSEHHGDPPVHVAVAPVVDAVKRIDGQRLVGTEDRTPLRWLDGLVVASASTVSSALERCAATGSGAEAHDWSPLELLRAPARVLASSILG